MKGSAMAIFRLHELQVMNNTFTENEPITTFSETEYSPYFKYLAQGSRTLTLNVPVECSRDYSNEFEYIEKCVSDGNFIDMPTLTGAVHIKHCLDDTACFAPVSDAYTKAFYVEGGTAEEYAETQQVFRSQHQISRPYNHAEISFNVFVNNQVLPPMQSKQEE